MKSILLDEFLFAVSSIVPFIAIGCSVDKPPAALTLNAEANTLVRVVIPITADVTAENNFFISVFPFRTFRSLS